MKRSNEPFFWLLFSGGGTLAALFLPALLFLLFIAPALGLVEPQSFEQMSAKLRPVPVRLFLLVLITMSLFHWGHRFRFTLYDGLQLKHLFGLIATLCYGGAAALSLLTAYLLWTFP